ncbi:hypothetical protein HZA98_01165 [Candidatus Woesearchaeota archaeon]|nr:hypothetical protein [Candidatus Woesearchaeota archaeon]
METKKLILLEKFVKERLPEAEKNRVIIIIDQKSFSWLQVLEELKKGGELAKKIEKDLEAMTK